jgi:hypothetical protein
VDFDLTDGLLFRFSAFLKYWKKWKCNETVHQLFIGLYKAYGSVRRDVLYNILIEFGVSMKLVRLFKTCLNETYSKVRMGKYLSGSFFYPKWSGIRRSSITTAFLLCFRICY